MTKYIYITADTNDGDYVSDMTIITDEELEIIKPVIEAIKNCKTSHNWETGEMAGNCRPKDLYVKTGILTQEQVDDFSEYCPHGEYGIHTIEEITLYNVESEEELL